MMWDYAGNAGYAWIGFAGMILFWGVVIWAITRTISNAGVSRTISHVDAAQILEVRFARGEIDAAEFEARRHELSS